MELVVYLIIRIRIDGYNRRPKYRKIKKKRQPAHLETLLNRKTTTTID